MLSNERNSTQGTAALRDFDPVYVADGSKLGLPAPAGPLGPSGRLKYIATRLRRADYRKDLIRGNQWLLNNASGENEDKLATSEKSAIER
jgi:hypothetical protein